MSSTARTLTDFSPVVFVKTLFSNINHKNEIRQLAYQNYQQHLQSCLLQIQSRDFFFDQINLHFEILRSIAAESRLWNSHRKIPLNEVELHPSGTHTAYISSDWKATKS